MKKMSASLGFCLSLLLPSAYAGTYFGVDAGSAINNDAKSVADIHFGYRISEIVAAEVGYSDISKAKIAGPDGSNKDIHFIHASGLVYLPLPAVFTAMLDIYGRVGMGYSSVKTSGSYYTYTESTTSSVIGVGAEFNMIPFVSLRAEVQHIQKLAGGGQPTIFKLGANLKF